MRAALALACVGWMSIAAVAQADPVETLRASRRTLTDQPVLLRTHAHWDGNCRALTDPRITWVVEPAHGQVDQVADTVPGHANIVGNTNCEGVEMRGIRLTYRPEPGFHGVDALSYDVRYDAKTPVIRYEFKVRVESPPASE
jgi:hypothetical protein